MLFEDVGRRRATSTGRVRLLVITAGGSCALWTALRLIADALPLQRVTPEEWVQHAALNGLGLSIILHVAIGRRWPFDRPAPTPTPTPTPTKKV